MRHSKAGRGTQEIGIRDPSSTCEAQNGTQEAKGRVAAGVADLRQVEEEVLRLAHDGTCVAQLACRLDQFDRVEKLAAAVALVAARSIRRARRALAFHVAVGQEAETHHTFEY